MNKAITIAGRQIGPGCEPYVIAEMSGNHNGDINRALELVELAHRSGADAVKLQTYTADTITLNCDASDFQIEGGLWDGRTLYELYDEAHTPWAWHRMLFDKAAKLGITIFSSPFDATAVDFLEDLNCPAYKVASFEAVDLPLIQRVAETKKPMIISTGMATIDEINEALDAARSGGADQIILLHCVSGYPTLAEEANLATIKDMALRFGVPVGLSDHTMGTSVSVAAVVLGAVVIEKHFTLARADGGPDAAFSLEADELAQLTRDCKMAWQAVGESGYDHKPSEEQNVQFRRSLYAVADIGAGQLLTPKNVRSIRPGYGLAPKHLADVINRTAKADIARGTPIHWDLLKD